MIFKNLEQTVVRQGFPFRRFLDPNGLCVVAYTHPPLGPRKEGACLLHESVLVVLSTCAQIQVCHGDEVLLTSSTYNDYYGFATSLEAADKALVLLQDKYQVDASSSLRFGMAVEIEVHVYGWVSGKLMAITENVYADHKALRRYLANDVNARFVKDRPPVFTAGWDKPMTPVWKGRTALERPDIAALRKVIDERFNALGVAYLPADTSVDQLFDVPAQGGDDA